MSRKSRSQLLPNKKRTFLMMGFITRCQNKWPSFQIFFLSKFLYTFEVNASRFQTQISFIGSPIFMCIQTIKIYRHVYHYNEFIWNSRSQMCFQICFIDWIIIFGMLRMAKLKLLKALPLELSGNKQRLHVVLYEDVTDKTKIFSRL